MTFVIKLKGDFYGYYAGLYRIDGQSFVGCVDDINNEKVKRYKKKETAEKHIEEIKNRLSNILEYIEKLENENEQLKQQIEQMKNCVNCKYATDCDSYCSCALNDCENLNKWELAE